MASVKGFGTHTAVVQVNWLSLRALGVGVRTPSAAGTQRNDQEAISSGGTISP
jgi:hypothetical protein